ncbi:hypothetical protein [Pimelobacter simplex]|uniref:hypothetical protein n=1 Tax=Nocardioides simplex TaxID=2045 RepID=UPI003AAC4310
MTAPYDHHALWLKAKLFLNRAMDEHESRAFDERALWAALALELLGKAALARVSPLLIAEPNEDGGNLLVAAGLVDGSARFTSVRASTVFARCQRAFLPFNQDEAMKTTHARNEYLHGATPGFTPLPEQAFWPAYWRQATILNNATDHDLADLVGEDRETLVQDYLAQNKKNTEHQVQMLIAQAKMRKAQHESGTLPTRVSRQWAPGIDRTAGYDRWEHLACPACDNQRGVIEGDQVSHAEADPLWDPDGSLVGIMVRVTVYSEHYSCSACGLVLNLPDLLVEAGLPAEFETEGTENDVEPDEPDYGND